MTFAYYFIVNFNCIFSSNIFWIDVVSLFVITFFIFKSVCIIIMKQKYYDALVVATFNDQDQILRISMSFNSIAVINCDKIANINF